LEFGKPSGINAYAGPLVVGGGGGGPYEARWLNSYQNVGVSATLYANGIVNLNNHAEDFGPVTFNGGEVDTGTGQFNIYAPLTINPAPTSAVINGYLGLPPGDNRVFIVVDGGSDCDLLVNAVIFGSPGTYFVKQGAGTMCLTGASTFDAPTLLEEGIIDINNSSGLGTWPGLVIFDGATLRLSNSGTGGGFEGIGAGVGGTHGAIELPPNASWTLAGGILLDGPITFNVGASSGLGISAAISSSGPGCSVIKTGAGTLVFSGAANNTYSGDTIISNGGIYLSKSANVASVPGNLIIGPGPSGPVTFARLLQLGGMWGTTVTVNGNSLLDLNGYNQTLTQVRLNDGGNLSTGAGSLILPAGTLVQVGSLDPIAGSTTNSTLSGFIALPTSGTITVSVAAFQPGVSRAAELELTASISGANNHGGTATLMKEGAGHMRLSGNSSFQGNLGINSGTVIAASANALGSSFRGTAVNNGASLVLEGGISIAAEYLTLDSTNSAALENLNGANTWGGTVYLNRNSSVSCGNLGSLSIVGVIEGPGSLIKVGTGVLQISGPNNNTYTGETFVNGGTLLLNKPIAVTAIPTALEIGGLDEKSVGTARNLNGYQIVGNIHVHSGGLYDVDGQEENTDGLVMYGNATVQTGSGSLYLKPGAPLLVYPGSNTTATLDGNLALYAGNHVLTVAAGSILPAVHDLIINAVISETSPSASIQKEGAGGLQLTATNTYTGTTTVNAGLLQIHGSQSGSEVIVNNAILQGDGTVGDLSFNGTTGLIVPGAGPGILTCGNFNAAALGRGTLQMELNGTTAGTGYDRINARGTVTLTGTRLSLALGFNSSANDQFILLQNDGTDPVVGSFIGLPEGTNFYAGGERFTISYAGGSGNDVVVTRLVTPPKPALTIQRVAPVSVRLRWPTNDPAYALQSANTLASNTWISSGLVPTVIGTNFVIINISSNPATFFRLSR
jgi:autotransporter-associated beta strand protein